MFATDIFTLLIDMCIANKCEPNSLEQASGSTTLYDDPPKMSADAHWFLLFN